MDQVSVTKQENEKYIITVTTQILDEPDRYVVRNSRHLLDKQTMKVTYKVDREVIKK